MSTKQKKKYLIYSILLTSIFTAFAQANAAPNDAGAELNRIRQQIEQEKIHKDIQQKRDSSSQVEGAMNKAQGEQMSSLKFTLKQIETTPSVVLSTAELEHISVAYINKEIQIQDLYTIVEDINKLYQTKGFNTCQAFLKPQTIKNGKVYIELIEGKTLNINVQGNNSTNKSYIINRVHLKKGDVANISQLNKDLLRFNATNDIQLRVALQPGAEFGTTDYIITAQEPQKSVFGIFSDNAGSKTSGILRGGFFWQNKSLFGNRDNLTLTSVLSEGNKSFMTSYAFPVSHNGNKLGLTYSTNSVHIIDGPLEPLNVTGHSYALGVSFTKPLVTAEKVKSEIGVEYGYQKSKTDFSGKHWVDDTIQGITLFYDKLNYGRNTVFYQKHAYKFGTAKNISSNSSNFGKYNFNTLWQQTYSANQIFSVRLDGQFSQNNYLPSAEQFYIGGAYSVRGYSESLLSGDGGIVGSLEYAFPISSNKQTNLYFFFDGGRVWGASSFDDKTLASVGLGIKSRINNNMYFNLGMGVPLVRKLNNAEQNSARLHFTFNSQF